MAATPAIETLIDLALQKLLAAVSVSGLASDATVIRMLPKIGETIDKLPGQIISPYGDAQAEPASFEADVFATYDREITLVDAIDGDFATQMALYQTWKAAVMFVLRFMPDGEIRDGLDGCPSVWQIEILKAPTFDRNKLASNYAYFGIVVRIHSSE